MNKKHYFLAAFFLVTIVLALAFLLSTKAPRTFPLNTPVEITAGYSANQIIKQLKTEQLIKSEFVFSVVLSLFNDPTKIKAGTYAFETSQNNFELAKTITDIAPPENLVTLTLPEGFTNKEFARIASKTLTDFDEDKFLQLAADKEGFLFPDTYLVPADYSPQELVDLLSQTFDLKTKSIENQLNSHRLTKEGLITMASILEREANTTESMRTVAGIFDTRLNLGMPLQADASLEYVLEKPLSELTSEDLDIDSPYNTYLYKGLTPTPIGNPGLGAINAVLDPIFTDYLFYLTDADGNFYYSKSYQEHQSNIEKHLR